jgi:succinate-acetate transporter protein
VRWLGSILTLTGAILGISGLALLVVVMAGRRHEVALISRRNRSSGVSIILGTITQVIAHSAMRQDGDRYAAVVSSAMADTLSSFMSWSICLRLLGASYSWPSSLPPMSRPQQ